MHRAENEPSRDALRTLEKRIFGQEPKESAWDQYIYRTNKQGDPIALLRYSRWTDSEKIHGNVKHRKPDVMVHAVVVDPKYRTHGLAKAMMEELHSRHKRVATSTGRWETTDAKGTVTVTPPHPGITHLNESMGYRKVGKKGTSMWWFRDADRQEVKQASLRRLAPTTASILTRASHR